MRVVLAGLFFYVAMLYGTSWILELDNGNEPISKLRYLFFFIFLALLLVFTVIIFNKNRWRTIKGQSLQDYIKELDENGKLIKETYMHSKSLSFEDLGAGGVVFFIENHNDDVLCLNGQYLYDYSEITDDEELNQPRLFPTESFTLLKNKDNDELVDIELHGEVVDTLVFNEPDYSALNDITAVDLYKYDGKVIPNITFDQILSLWK